MKLRAVVLLFAFAAFAAAAFAQSPPAHPPSHGPVPARPAATPSAASTSVAGSLGESFFKNVGGFDHIQSDTVNYNFETGDFSLPGHFTAVREGTEISADHATGNSKRKELHADGHVLVHQTKALNSKGATSQLTQKPSTLTCDKLDVDGVRHTYVATGHVHFTQEKRNATADAATLDDTNHHLHLEGNVHIADGPQSLDAQVVDYDTQNGDMRAEKDVTIIAPVPTETPGPPRRASPAKPKKRRFL